MLWLNYGQYGSQCSNGQYSSIRQYRLAQYNSQKKIYINKKLLKETKVSITESLTVQHVAKLKEAKEKYGFNNVWSNDDNDGRIIYKDNGDDKTNIYFH